MTSLAVLGTMVAVLAVGAVPVAPRSGSRSGTRVGGSRPRRGGRVGGIVGPLVGLTARRTRRSRRRALVDGLPDLLEHLARSVRSGSSIRAAVSASVEGASPALAAELRPVVADLDRGRTLHDALDRWAQRRGDVAEIALATAAIGIAVETGGPIARALDGVADTVRAGLDLRAEVRALAAQAEASALLIVALPVVFVGVAAVIDPSTVVFLVSTRIGAGCLGSALVLDGAAWWWMRRIIAEIAP